MTAVVFDLSDERERRAASRSGAKSLRWTKQTSASGQTSWGCRAGPWAFEISQNDSDRRWSMRLRHDEGGVFRSLWQSWSSLGAAQAWTGQAYQRGLLDSYYGIPKWRLSPRGNPIARAEGFDVEIIRLDIDAWGYQLQDLDNGQAWVSDLRYRSETEARTAAIGSTKQLRELENLGPAPSREAL
jgi:hypothetical protein